MTGWVECGAVNPDHPDTPCIREQGHPLDFHDYNGMQWPVVTDLRQALEAMCATEGEPLSNRAPLVELWHANGFRVIALPETSLRELLAAYPAEPVSVDPAAGFDAFDNRPDIEDTQTNRDVFAEGYKQALVDTGLHSPVDSHLDCVPAEEVQAAVDGAVEEDRALRVGVSDEAVARADRAYWDAFGSQEVVAVEDGDAESIISMRAALEAALPLLGVPQAVPEVTVDEWSTPACPEHGEHCAGPGCCCRDKHPSGPEVTVERVAEVLAGKRVVLSSPKHSLWRAATEVEGLEIGLALRDAGLIGGIQ